ncbi:hypothetical protein Syun_003341 [Stephania yunnanensis]|uniref:Uncharacterized protein n=1 Tax=Stephania yunnanensis TaxID=152371 RepID=A0AAP0L332_9MAGN
MQAREQRALMGAVSNTSSRGQRAVDRSVSGERAESRDQRESGEGAEIGLPSLVPIHKWSMTFGKSAFNFRRICESHDLDGKVLTMPKGTVLPANPNILEDTDDLIQLSFLNELSVLYNLWAEIRGNELVSGCGKKPRVSLKIYYWAKGKLIDIHFKPTGKVFGAKIQISKSQLDFKEHREEYWRFGYEFGDIGTSEYLGIDVFLRLCWMEVGDLVWEIWCCLKRFGNGGLDLEGFGGGVRSLSCSLPELVPSANGLDTKVEKSRKQMKERKNKAKKIRGVKKLGANAILVVSLLVWKAGASVKKVPLYKLLTWSSSWRIVTVLFLVTHMVKLTIKVIVWNLMAKQDLKELGFLREQNAEASEKEIEVSNASGNTLPGSQSLAVGLAAGSIAVVASLGGN